MKKQTKNKFLILLICLLIQACSASNEQKGVVSLEDLTIQTTITTVTTVQDSPEIQDLTEEEAQLILAGCLREKGYDVADPKNDEGLRTVLTPIFISFNEKQRE